MHIRPSPDWIKFIGAAEGNPQSVYQILGSDFLTLNRVQDFRIRTTVSDDSFTLSAISETDPALTEKTGPIPESTSAVRKIRDSFWSRRKHSDIVLSLLRPNGWH